VQVAKRLGYSILFTSDRFPDLLPEDLSTGNTVMAEVELHSSNYKAHDHPQDGRTVIVCWEHNWPETTQPVIELRSLIELPDPVLGGFQIQDRKEAELNELPYYDELVAFLTEKGWSIEEATIRFAAATLGMKKAVGELDRRETEWLEALTNPLLTEATRYEVAMTYYRSLPRSLKE